MLHNDITLCEKRKKMCEAVRLTFPQKKLDSQFHEEHAGGL